MEAKWKIIFSMVVFGTISIFVKNIALSSAEIALSRAVIAAIVIIGFQSVTRSGVKLSEIKGDLPALFVSGAMIGFNWILLFQAYKYTTVSIATLSYYFAPVIVIVACPILFKEKLTRNQILCFIMATIGLVMVIGINGQAQAKSTLLGIVFGLGAASLYATIILINKSIKRVAGIDRTLIQFIAAIIVLTPYVFATTGCHVGSLGAFGAVNLLILGVLHTGICYCLYFSALKDVKGQEAAILGYIDPLVAIIVSVTVLGESIFPLQIIGGLMILGFTLLNEIKG